MPQRNWPITFRWAAAGTIAVYSAIGCLTLKAEQLSAPPELASQLSAAVRLRRYDIPAGVLDEAMRLFAQISGIEVAMNAEGIGSLATPGFSGSATAQHALDEILSGTGVHARFSGSNRIILELNSVSVAVDVTASESALPASMAKFTEPLRDTPQTIDVISQHVMEEQNVTTLRDALRNAAGISIAAGEAGAQGDNMTIRGFSARNDMYIDGMRDFGSYYRDPFNLEEVEVVQGPSSATFGRGSTGGVINQATKMPNLLRSAGGAFDAGTDKTRRATVDINTPFKAFGSPAAFRLNLMGTEGDVAGRDAAHNRRYGIAPSLSFGLGTATRVGMSFLNQQADDTPDYGIPWLLNQPAPVNRRNYYGFSDGSNYLRTKDNIASLRAEHDFGSSVTVRNQTRYARYHRDVQITEPQIAGATPVTALSSINVTRNELVSNSLEAFLANQTDVTAHFQTGPLRHTLVSGLEFDREDSDPTRPRYTGVPTTPLLNPNPSQPFAGSATINTIVHTRANTAAVYAIDTVKLGGHWELNGAFRFDRFAAHYTQQVAPAAAFNRLDHLPAFRGSVVYKPITPASVYLSIGNSYNPSAESLSLAANTANLPPEENRTYEGGLKWDFRQSGLSLRTAVFRTDKLNAREPDPANSLTNVLAGKQRVNGLQVNFSGHVTSRWEMQTGYALLDAKLAASNFYPNAAGARLANVPRHTLNFWHTYEFPWGIRAGAGGNFVGSRTASSTVPIEPVSGLVKQTPGYWVFNAMLEKRLTEHATLHANIYNLADRYYYDQLHPGHVVPGPARYSLIGIRFRF